MHLFIKSRSVWPIFSLFSVFSKLWHLGPYLIHRGGKQLLCMHNFDVWTKHSQPILPNTSSQLPILNTPGQGTGQLKPRVHRYFSNYPILNPLSLFTFLYSFPKNHNEVLHPQFLSCWLFNPSFLLCVPPCSLQFFILVIVFCNSRIY